MALIHPDSAKPRFEFNLQRSLGLSVLAILVLLWSGYAALTFSERDEAVNDAREELASVAMAAAQYAQLVTQVEHQPPLGEQPIGVTTHMPREPTTRALAVFLAGLHPSQGIHIALRTTTPRERRTEQNTLRTADIELVETESPDGFMADANSANGRLAATARISRADALSSWRTGALVEGGGLTLVTIVIGLFAAFFIRQLRQRDEMNLMLRDAKEQADAGSRAKSNFLANMSHELRTPLNAVLGFSEILVRELFGSLGSERYRQYARDIHNSGAHLLDLVNDVLDLSKLDTGELHLDKKPFDLQECLKVYVRAMEPAAQTARVRLSLRSEGDLPLLHADATRIRQIVLNLLSNAIKFTREGGDITVSAHRVGDKVAIAVADTGIGISPEDIPRVLSRFGQVESAMSRTHDGSGLGLPIAKHLAELHGGSLEIQSAIGKGTTVTVTLPLQRALATSKAA